MEKKKMIIMGGVAFIGLLLGILVGIGLNSFFKPAIIENDKEAPSVIENVADTNDNEAETQETETDIQVTNTTEAETSENTTASQNEDSSEPVEITVDSASTTSDTASTKIPYSAANGMCMPDETGKYVKYEIIINNVAWEDARKDCKKRGGHLLTINDMTEFNTVSKFIVDQKADSNLFLLGGMREEKSDKYYWVDSAKTPVDDTVLNKESAWCNSFWAAGEPSFHDNHENDECYMMTYFSQTENKWLWCDVINDYIGMSENDRGRLAYICEYE